MRVPLCPPYPPLRHSHEHTLLNQSPGKKATVDALFGPLIAPTLAIATDPTARPASRSAALAALSKAAARSKGAASAIVTSDPPAWRALAGAVLPKAGDFGVQTEVAYLLYSVLKAGVAGAVEDATLGEAEVGRDLRGLARRPASSLAWEEEARRLVAAYNARRGKDASLLSVRATYVVAKALGGTASTVDRWVDFGIPKNTAGGARARAGAHATVFMAADGDPESQFTVTIPYGKRLRIERERERECAWLCGCARAGARGSGRGKPHFNPHPLHPPLSSKTRPPCGPRSPSMAACA